HAGPQERAVTTRKTRIVATLGPASSSPDMLRRLLVAGVDVVRLNFSHGSHAEHAAAVRAVRRASAETGLPVGILQDLPGPKMRVGPVHGDAVELQRGARLQAVEDHATGDARRLSFETEGVLAALPPGAAIMLADGQIELRVLARSPKGLACEVV